MSKKFKLKTFLKKSYLWLKTQICFRKNSYVFFSLHNEKCVGYRHFRKFPSNLVYIMSSIHFPLIPVVDQNLSVLAWLLRCVLALILAIHLLKAKMKFN